MSSWTEILLPLSARLPLPQPARSRVLLEVAADLEDVFQHYRAAGLSDEEARRKAVDTFELSDTALTELVQVHISPIRKLLDRLSVRSLSLWERVLLALVALTTLFVSGRLLVAQGIAADAGLFLWPPALCGVAGVVLGAALFSELYVKQEHDARRARRRLDGIAYLAFAQVVLGFIGAWARLFVAARRMPEEMERAGVFLFDAILGGAALISVGLLGALIVALIWFALARRVAAIEDADAVLLTVANGGAPREDQRKEHDHV